MIMSSAGPFSSMKYTRHMRPRDCVYCYAEFGGVVLNRLDCVNCDIADQSIFITSSLVKWASFHLVEGCTWETCCTDALCCGHEAVCGRDMWGVSAETQKVSNHLRTCGKKHKKICLWYVTTTVHVVKIGQPETRGQENISKKGDYWNSLSFNSLWSSTNQRNTKHYLFPTYQNVSVVHQRELSIFNFWAKVG